MGGLNLSDSDEEQPQHGDAAEEARQARQEAAQHHAANMAALARVEAAVTTPTRRAGRRRTIN